MVLSEVGNGNVGQRAGDRGETHLELGSGAVVADQAGMFGPIQDLLHGREGSGALLLSTN